MTQQEVCTLCNAWCKCDPRDGCVADCTACRDVAVALTSAEAWGRAKERERAATIAEDTRINHGYEDVASDIAASLRRGGSDAS